MDILSFATQYSNKYGQQNLISQSLLYPKLNLLNIYCPTFAFSGFFQKCQRDTINIT